MIFKNLQKYFFHEKPSKKGPSFMIVGAQKAGTTALFNYFSQHPQIIPTETKELHFFNCDLAYSKGINFYHAQFPETRSNQHTFDGTPGYLRNESVPERIFRYNPNIKLIIILRDPVERAFSAWNMYRNLFAHNSQWFSKIWVRGCNPASKVLPRTAEEIEDFSLYYSREIELENSSAQAVKLEAEILSHGCYAAQIERFYQHFPHEQIIILENRELKSDTVGVLRQIERFTGLEAFDWSTADLTPVFEGNYGLNTLNEEDKRRLDNYYAPHNRALFQLLGKKFAW